MDWLGKGQTSGEMAWTGDSKYTHWMWMVTGCYTLGLPTTYNNAKANPLTESNSSQIAAAAALFSCIIVLESPRHG